MNEFYTLLNEFINTHEASTAETKERKDEIVKFVNQLCNEYFDTYKKNYNSKRVKDEEKRGHDYKQFEIIDKKNQK